MRTSENPFYCYHVTICEIDDYSGDLITDHWEVLGLKLCEN